MSSPRGKPAPPSASGQDFLVGAWPGFVLCALAFLVYSPALAGPFLWDDARAITENPAFASPNPLWAIWTGVGDPDYLPLKSTWLWLLYRAFGAKTWPYHIANVAIHAANAILLWRVLRRLAVPGAWLAGLVFVLHPTHVESVAWISEHKNTLSTAFGLAAVLAWLAHRRTRRVRDYATALLLFVAGLLCKGHLVVVPVALLLCAWWQDTAPDAEAPRMTRRRWLAGQGRALWPFFAVAVGFAATTVWLQQSRAIREYQLPAGHLPSRIANAGKAAWWYLGKSLSPVHLWYEMPSRPVESEPEAQEVLAGVRPPNAAPAWPRGRFTLVPLSMIYPRWRVTAPVWYDLIPALALLACYAWIVRRRAVHRGLFVGCSFFLVALLPVLGLVKMSYMRAAWVADHFQYLADLGVIALGCAALARAAQGKRRWLAGAVAAVVVLGYATASFARALDYRSERALWQDTVDKNPGAWQAQTRLGAALLARGDLAGAAKHFAQGVRWKPDNADGRNNLGLALVGLGRVDEGIAQYRESIRLHPTQFFAYANLGDALSGQRRFADAVSAYRDAIRWQPALAPLHHRLGLALVEGGRLDEAAASLRRAAELAPGNPEIAAALDRLQRLRTTTAPPSAPP